MKITDFKNKWVRKSNHTLFKNFEYSNKPAILTPVVFVKNTSGGNQHRGIHIYGNGNAHILTHIDALEIIPYEEARKCLQIYKSCKSLSVSLPETEQHIRTDTDTEKVKLHEDHFSQVLYRFKMRNPAGNFSAYRCKICDAIHIGKMRA